MRILITGSRDWTNEAIIQEVIESHHRERVIECRDSVVHIIHGDCPTGADALADRLADLAGWVVSRHPADWNRYGKRAGYIRNVKMVDVGADICLAFIKNNSRGATMCADLAEKAGIRTVRIVEHTS